MSFDPVAQFINAKNAFTNARGADPPSGVAHEDSGQPLVSPSKLVPRTTWGDIFLFGSSFRTWADPSRGAGCRELYEKDGMDTGEAKARCVLTGHPHADFVHTAHYKRAAALWRAWQPLDVLSASRGPIGAAGDLTSKILTPTVYPFNEEFWGYGVRYAIARSAAGVVKSRFEILVESVSEAIEEAPDLVVDALESAANAAAGLVPDFSGTIKLLKWSTLLGGGALLYWYGLRPKRPKQKETP